MAPTSTSVPRSVHAGHWEVRSATVGCRPHTAFRRSSPGALTAMRRRNSNTRDAPKPLTIQGARTQLSAQLTVKFARFILASAPGGGRGCRSNATADGLHRDGLGRLLSRGIRATVERPRRHLRTPTSRRARRAIRRSARSNQCSPERGVRVPPERGDVRLTSASALLARPRRNRLCVSVVMGVANLRDFACPLPLLPRILQPPAALVFYRGASCAAFKVSNLPHRRISRSAHSRVAPHATPSIVVAPHRR